jgi:hypothetical protein
VVSSPSPRSRSVSYRRFTATRCAIVAPRDSHSPIARRHRSSPTRVARSSSPCATHEP